MIDSDSPDISFLCHANDIITRVVESTFPVRPVAVIVYGTPGSGKSRILQNTLSKYGLQALTQYWRCVIDSKAKPAGFDQGSFDLLCHSESVLGFASPPSTDRQPIALSHQPSVASATTDLVPAHSQVSSQTSKIEESVVEPGTGSKPTGLGPIQEAAHGRRSSIEDSSHRASHYQDFNVVPILHDEILTNIPSYKAQLPEFVRRIRQVASSKLQDYDPIAAEFNQQYRKYQSYVYLVTSHLIDTCLANKRNILIETTGNNLSYIEETIKKIKGNGYYVVCLFPFTKREVIYQRIIDRGRKCGRILSSELIDNCYSNCFTNFFKLSIKCDEVYLFDTLLEFGTTPLLYYKRYENYRIAQEVENNLDQVSDYLHSLYPRLELGRVRGIIRRRGSFSSQP